MVNINFANNPFLQAEANAGFSADPSKNLANLATRLRSQSRAGGVTALQQALANRELDIDTLKAQGDLLGPLAKNLSPDVSSQLLSSAPAAAQNFNPETLALTGAISQRGQQAGVAKTQAETRNIAETGGGEVGFSGQSFDPVLGTQVQTDVREPRAIRQARVTAGLKPVGKTVTDRIVADPTAVGGFRKEKTETQIFEDSQGNRFVEAPDDTDVIDESDINSELEKQLPAEFEINTSVPVDERGGFKKFTGKDKRSGKTVEIFVRVNDNKLVRVRDTESKQFVFIAPEE